ncbi:uncharacterized protein SCHCODRAFT_02621012 [Schizophyllum commune H4-8]|uniref:uncharacterized protein n=1 Tax=Schizophyllum commune (strain H4-8 / FGSC 9210) TaxID=578458 RepID=UPI00215F4F80|nr:uncharacterized protein SCHCODRAFT_02621012 [Schizophyllum commune H4-8]KAI5893158.1 hypothetical protein SCHCODRAFT_02621012 [Schizophyllum commune H4-8]
MDLQSENMTMEQLIVINMQRHKKARLAEAPDDGAKAPAPKRAKKIHRSWAAHVPERLPSALAVIVPSVSTHSAGTRGRERAQRSPSPLDQTIAADEWTEEDVTMIEAAPAAMPPIDVPTCLRELESELAKLLDAGKTVISLENTGYRETQASRLRRAKAVESGRRVISIAEDALGKLRTVLGSLPLENK